MVGLILLGLITILNPSEPYQKNVLFLVDVSGSISDSMIKEALNGFSEVNNVPLDEYNFTAWAFDGGLYKYPGGWQQSSPLAVSAVCKWIKNGRKDWKGDTQIVPALTATILDKKKNKTIVIISDGMFNEHTEDVEKVIKKLKFQVGFIGIGEQRKNLLTLAKIGGGGYRVTRSSVRKDGDGAVQAQQGPKHKAGVPNSGAGPGSKKRGIQLVPSGIKR